MKKLFVIILTLALLCISATVTFGFPSLILDTAPSGYGARADAMGGAFVAVADDGLAPYYNPAGIQQLKARVLTADLGFSGYNSYTPYFEGGGGITTPSFAANIYFSDPVKIFPDASRESLKRIDCVLTGATTLFNKSVAIGGNLKFAGAIYDASIYAIDEGMPFYIDHSFRGGALTYDIGVLVKPMNFISIGLVGRNMNEPFFNLKENDSKIGLQLQSSIVAGIALKPSSSMTLAADYETGKDQSGDSASLIRMGFEHTSSLKTLAIRLGMSADPENIAGTRVITGGFGLKILHVYADITIVGFNLEYPVMEFTGSFRL